MGKQTNQRAEIMAAIRALQVVPKTSNVIIFTDSNYLVNAMTKWIKAWRRNGYLNVKNSDLFKLLDSLVVSFYVQPQFKHVRAHAGIEGNEMADVLAKEGAMAHNVISNPVRAKRK